MAKIDYALHLDAEDTVYNEVASEYQAEGFGRLKDLQRTVKQQFKLFSCPECGSKNVGYVCVKCWSSPKRC